MNCLCNHQTIYNLSTRLMSKPLSYFKAVTFLLVTFRVKNIVSFCVKKSLPFGLMLHFASKVVLFRVNVTFCVNCYVLRRNLSF